MLVTGSIPTAPGSVKPAASQGTILALLQESQGPTAATTPLASTAAAGPALETARDVKSLPPVGAATAPIPAGAAKAAAVNPGDAATPATTIALSPEQLKLKERIVSNAQSTSIGHLLQSLIELGLAGQIPDFVQNRKTLILQALAVEATSGDFRIRPTAITGNFFGVDFSRLGDVMLLPNETYQKELRYAAAAEALTTVLPLLSAKITTINFGGVDFGGYASNPTILQNIFASPSSSVDTVVLRNCSLMNLPQSVATTAFRGFKTHVRHLDISDNFLGWAGPHRTEESFICLEGILAGLHNQFKSLNVSKNAWKQCAELFKLIFKYQPQLASLEVSDDLFWLYIDPERNAAQRTHDLAFYLHSRFQYIGGHCRTFKLCAQGLCHLTLEQFSVLMDIFPDQITVFDVSGNELQKFGEPGLAVLVAFALKVPNRQVVLDDDAFGKRFQMMVNQARAAAVPQVNAANVGATMVGAAAAGAGDDRKADLVVATTNTSSKGVEHAVALSLAAKN